MTKEAWMPQVYQDICKQAIYKFNFTKAEVSSVFINRKGGGGREEKEEDYREKGKHLFYGFHFFVHYACEYCVLMVKSFPLPFFS